MHWVSGSSVLTQRCVEGGWEHPSVPANGTVCSTSGRLLQKGLEVVCQRTADSVLPLHMAPLTLLGSVEAAHPETGAHPEDSCLNSSQKPIL